MSEQQNLNSLMQANNAMVEKESYVTVEEGMFYDFFNKTSLWLEPKGHLKDKLIYRTQEGENRRIISMAALNCKQFFNNYSDGELGKIKCRELFEILKDNNVKVRIHHHPEEFLPFPITEADELTNEELKIVAEQTKIKKQIRVLV